MVLVLSFIAMPTFIKAQTVTLDYKNQPLDVVLKSITDQTGYKFVYSSSVIDSKQLVSVTIKSGNINTLLNALFKNTNITYSIVGKQVALITSDAFTDNEKATPDDENYITIKGTILDRDKQPLIGVTILNKNTGQGALSDLDGNYTMRAKIGDVLIYRYVGMEAQEVTVSKGKMILNINMDTDENILENVVVTGYQTISKERATGSFTILTAKDIANKTETNLMSRLEGMVPGVRYDQDTELATIRGTATFRGKKGALYVVDGIPYEGELSYINPNDVVNMTVLKDAAAASIYGAAAANGVIVITTRSGQEGKIRVGYNSTIHFSRPASLKHQNLTSSKELVDYFQKIYKIDRVKEDYVKIYERGKNFVDPVFEAMILHDEGTITSDELNSRLNRYSSLDNRDQIYDALSRTSLTHQHNLSVSGGNKIYRFSLSMNYMENNKHDKFASSKQYGINTKNEFNITPKLKAYINLSANFNTVYEDNYKGRSYSSLLSRYPSYYMLRDENGELLPFPNGGTYGGFKSAAEIERLKEIGLKDETYYPTLDVNTAGRRLRTEYTRIQGGINWEIIDGLSANGLYQLEISNEQDRIMYEEDSYFMRNKINDAAQYNKETKEITYNVPKGGRLDSYQAKMKSYTLRGQLNYSKTFNEDHMVTALAGAERREVRNTRFGNVYWGFLSNGYDYDMDVNPLLYGGRINGTQSINGYYMDQTLSYGSSAYRPIDNEHRFVSFFGNASYSFKQRYDISGSIRVDESSLFGRAPGNRYRPIWSVGAGWHISEEPFMNNIKWIDRLSLRTTYGLGGNISNYATPYPTIFSMGLNHEIGGNTLYISTPSNENLRWEKTATTNFGFEFAILGSRIRGGFDYYLRRTTDLLGDKNADPTLGFNNVLINYGSMDNDGFEISLNSTNIKTKNFSWNTGFTFSYNKSKLRNITATQRDVMRYLISNPVVLGRPLSAVYSTRYAGLNETGIPLFYNQKDEAVDYGELTVDDLVYSGTAIPVFSGAIMNSLSFKNFDLSFRIIYSGGNVIRANQKYILDGSEDRNFNRRALNFWMQPGDELDPSKSPRIATDFNEDWIKGYNAIEDNIEKGDYLKLRDVNLSYRFPKSIASKLRMEQLSLSFQVNDLYTWSVNGYDDPEYTSLGAYAQYDLSPKPRPSFSFGININF